MESNANLNAEFDHDDKATPPLSIRHFLYWTAGVAAALWLKFGNDPPKPKNLAGVLLVSSSIAYCIAAGGAVAFLIWITICRVSSRNTPMRDPGTKYAAILGITMFFASLDSLGQNQLVEYSESNPDAWLQWSRMSSLAQEAIMIGILLCGIIWIGGVAWRIAMGSSLILNLFSAYDSLTILEIVPSYANPQTSLSDAIDWIRDSLHYVPICAVAVSILVDWQRGSRRNWEHYYGVVLCVIITVEFALVQIALAILSFNRS